MAYNQNMCPSDMDSILVTVNPPLNGTLSPDQDICPGYPAALLVAGSGGNGGPYTYTWVDGAGNVVALQTLSVPIQLLQLLTRQS